MKGKKEPQEVYELIKSGEVETRIGASVAKGLTRFVGRKNPHFLWKTPLTAGPSPVCSKPLGKNLVIDSYWMSPWRSVLDNEFDIVMGPVEYDDKDVAIFTGTAHQWWDGIQLIVYPFELAEWETKLAPPWNER